MECSKEFLEESNVKLLKLKLCIVLEMDNLLMTPKRKMVLPIKPSDELCSYCFALIMYSNTGGGGGLN